MFKCDFSSRRFRPKNGYGPDGRDQNKGIGQTKQIKKWVLARPKRPKYGHWPERRD